MKKALSIALALFMLLSVCAFPIAAAPEGTAITDAAGFAAMTADGTYYLANDITIDATYEGVFAGTLNGNGKTITTSAPLFATLGSANIKNLKLAGEITIEAENAAVLTTTVAAGSTLVIDNVENNCKLTVAQKKDVGGFIGNISYANCYGTDITIKNSTNNAAITGGWRVGGFVGNVDGSDDAGKPFNMTIENCVNNGDIVSTESYASGIVSRFGGDKDISGKCQLYINYCTNNGNATSATDQVGGICAFLRGKTTIEYSINNADLTATVGKNMAVGGIIGKCGSKTQDYGDGACVRYCMNYGKISTTSKGGGIVGNLGDGKRSYGAACIESCINYGEITVEDCYSDGTTYAGGIAAYMYGGSGEGSNTIRNCLNLGKITGVTSAASGKNYAGGILGYVNGTKITIANNLNLGEITITSTTTADKFTHTFFNNIGAGKEAPNCVNNYSIAVSSKLLEENGDTANGTTVVTAAEAAAKDFINKLSNDGSWIATNDGYPMPNINTAIGGTGADFSSFVEAPETTEPAPDTTEPSASGKTGDSFVIFALVAAVSVLGVALVAKKREN